MYLSSIFKSSCNKKKKILIRLIDKKPGCDAQFNINLLSQIKLVEWLIMITSEKQADLIYSRENDCAFDVIYQVGSSEG